MNRYKKIQDITLKNNSDCIVISYCVGICHCVGILAQTLSTKYHYSLPSVD